jgi:hypothetical protein
VRESESDHCAREREQQALGQQVSDDARARRAERGAPGDLSFA